MSKVTLACVVTLMLLASSAPALAQTQLYLLTSASDVEVPVPVPVPNPNPNPECGYWDYGCDVGVIRVPGRVIHLDVDRLQIVAIRRSRTRSV